MGKSGLDWQASGRKVSLADMAYERIEELFVTMRLPPGAFIKTQDLQDLVDLGRTPVHQAVSRLAAETLFEVRPRDGLMVAPIDLTRESRLAGLRRDIGRFVVEQATCNLSSNDRASLSYLRNRVKDLRSTMSVEAFNKFDKTFDLLLISAARERFLERTLRPLQTLARRAGYLHLTRLSSADGLQETIDRHLAIMDGVLEGKIEKACKASDDLVCFSISLLDGLEGTVDPVLLDASLAKSVSWSPAKKADAVQNRAPERRSGRAA